MLLIVNNTTLCIWQIANYELSNIQAIFRTYLIFCSHDMTLSSDKSSGFTTESSGFKTESSGYKKRTGKSSCITSIYEQIYGRH